MGYSNNYYAGGSDTRPDSDITHVGSDTKAAHDMPVGKAMQERIRKDDTKRPDPVGPYKTWK